MSNENTEVRRAPMMALAITSSLRRTISIAFMLLLTSTAAFFSATSIAQSTGWVQDPMHPPVRVRALSTGHIDPSTRQMEMVLNVELDGEWKTYWRSLAKVVLLPSLIGATQPTSTTSNGIGQYPPIMSN